MADTSKLTIYSEDFLKRLQELKAIMSRAAKERKAEKTDRNWIKKRPDGYDYIEEGLMRDKLDDTFPGWSFEGFPMELNNNEWVWASGHLTIIDESLLAFGVRPPIRKFFGVGAARIQYKKNAPHVPENIIDIDKNMKAARSQALKDAIQRLTGLFSDVYRKRSDFSPTAEDFVKLNAAIDNNKEMPEEVKEKAREQVQHIRIMDVEHFLNYIINWRKQNGK